MTTPNKEKAGDKAAPIDGGAATSKEQEVAFQPREILVKLKGQLLPIKTIAQNPNDEAKKARGMTCMMCTDARIVKSIHTGLTYVFPPLEAVWVHKDDVNLCAGSGAAPYRALKEA